jgi:hypothetical protein
MPTILIHSIQEQLSTVSDVELSIFDIKGKKLQHGLMDLSQQVIIL